MASNLAFLKASFIKIILITCGIQLTGVGVVTMATEVLYNTCNMCIRNLPDMNTLNPQAYISGKSPMPMLQPLHIITLDPRY